MHWNKPGQTKEYESIEVLVMITKNDLLLSLSITVFVYVLHLNSRFLMYPNFEKYSNLYTTQRRIS